MVRHGTLAMLVLLGVHWSLAAQAPDVLRGRVVDAVTGVPVRNAVLSDLSRAVARTDADGRFELPRAEIRATLSITKSGYARHMLRSPVSSGPIEVRLEKGAALAVYVIDQSGAPVPDRRVNVTCKGSGRGGQADSAGRFRVAYLSEGACEVRFDNATPPMTRLDGPPTIEQLKARGEELRARALANVEAARTAPKTLIDLKAGDDVAYVAIDPSAAPPVPSMPPPRGPDGTGAIRGRILRADGEPLGGVLVRIAGQSTQTMRGATTSAAGEYAIAGLAADRYSVNATAPGYEAGIYGQGTGGAARRDVGGPGFVLGRIIDRGIDLTIEDGQRLDGINMVLQKHGGISGIVTDEYGDPAEEVEVWIAPVSDTTVVPLMAPAPPVSGLPRSSSTVRVGVRSRFRTDDRGGYHMSVPAGTYHVSASYGSGTRYFYPASGPISTATPVTVVPGKDVAHIDLLMLGRSGLRIEGTIVTAALPVSRAFATLSKDPTQGPPMVLQTMADERGDFTFDDVPPGEYVVAVTVSPPPYAIIDHRNGRPVAAPPVPIAEHGRASVTVDAGWPATVTVETRPERWQSLIGRVVFQDDPGGLTPANVMIRAVHMSGTARVDDDWSFEVTGLSEPTRFVMSSRTPGWWLKSLMVDGVNAADVPVSLADAAPPGEAVATLERTVAIEGRVRDGSGAISVGYRVVAFPVDRTHWYYQSRHAQAARPDQQGVFTLDLPRGEYWLAAVDRLDTPSPELFEQLLPQAVAITVTRPQRLDQDLRLITVAR